MSEANLLPDQPLWPHAERASFPADRDNSIRVRTALPSDGGSTLRPGVARLAGAVRSGIVALEDTWSLRSGRQRSSRRGSSDGGSLGTARSTVLGSGPCFDVPINKSGYAWWYVDAVSDDKEHALTIIALVGSVFSPYYAAAIEAGDDEPLNHCSMNVALYGPDRDAWAMTERGASEVKREPRSLAIGPSFMEWNGDGLHVSFDEITSPVPSRIRGSLRVKPHGITPFSATIDALGKHLWAPIAPCANVEVELSEPSLRWRGTAYFDSNMGDEPLAKAFSSWTWSRACGENAAAVTYDVARVDGSSLHLAKSFDPSGSVSDLPQLGSAPLGLTRWGLSRSISVDVGTSPRLLRTLEDTPFYARSLATAQFAGERVDVVHEALSLDRFQKNWVQFLLPFRMRRER